MNGHKYTSKAIENENRAKQQLIDLKNEYREDPEVMAEMFSFGANFHQYSLANMELIFSQNRGATYCQSFAAWKEMGIRINKGEHGLHIWVPVQQTILKNGNEEIPLSLATQSQKEGFKKGKIPYTQRLHFKLGNVFDISQTNYPKEEYPKLFAMGFDDDQYNRICQQIDKFSLDKLKCPVLRTDLKSISLRGCYMVDANVIKINDRLNDSERLSTTCHELGHAFIHNIYSDRAEKSTAQKELEADALSIMLQSNFALPLTDSRKRHFANHYKEFERECNLNGVNMDEQLDIIFGNVYKTFKENISEINEYVSVCLEPVLDKAFEAENQTPMEMLTNNMDRLKKGIEKSDRLIRNIRKSTEVNVTDFVTINKVDERKEDTEKICEIVPPQPK